MVMSVMIKEWHVWSHDSYMKLYAVGVVYF